MIKIGYIGGGNASAISMLSVLHQFILAKNLDNLVIECIHDPKIPVTTIGEGASVYVLYLLENVLNFSFENDGAEIDMTLRDGTNHTWEENLGKDFQVIYPRKACHMNADKTSGYIIKELTKKYSRNFKEHHDKIVEIKQTTKKVMLFGERSNYEYDYVIDCSGTPSSVELNSGLYNFVNFETVNSALIHPEFISYENTNTTVMFHKNGWMFGIPLRHRKAFGYLYNRHITSKEEAIAHFQTLKPEIDSKNLRFLDWTSYYRKEIIDNRILYLGNKLYFFEPAMGLPLHYYVNASSVFSDYLLNDDFSKVDIPDYMNKYHAIQMEKIQDIISLNYISKNDMTSKFWKEISVKSRDRLKKSIRFREWAEEVLDKDYYVKYWTLGSPVMAQYITGFGIDLKEFVS